MELLLILLPAFIYWCLDEKKGLGISAAVLLSMWFIFFLEYQNVYLPFGFAANLIITAVILCIYFLLGKKIEIFFIKGGFRAGMIVTAAFSFLMIMRLQGERLLIPGGILLGMGTGYCINYRYIGFKSREILGRTGFAKFAVLLVRFLLGGTGYLLILAATGKIIPQNSGNINLYGFIRYALAGFWVSAAAPWIFIRLRLAEKAVSAGSQAADEETGPEKSE